MIILRFEMVQYYYYYHSTLKLTIFIENIPIITNLLHFIVKTVKFNKI